MNLTESFFELLVSNLQSSQDKKQQDTEFFED